MSTRQPHSLDASSAAPLWDKTEPQPGRAWLQLAKALVAATSTADLQASCETVAGLVAAEGVALYGFRQGQRRQGFKQVSAFGLDLAPLIEASHPEFATLAHGASRRFLNLPGHTNYFALGIRRERKALGALIVKTTAGETLRELRTELRRFAALLLNAAERIAETEKQRLRCLTLHQLMHKTEEAFCSWREEQGWEFHNQHLLQRLGYRPEHIAPINAIGHPDAMDPDEWQHANKLLEHCVRSGQSNSFDYTVRAPSGAMHHFSTAVQVLRHQSDGSAEAIVCVSHDITEAHQIAAEASATLNLEKWLIDQTSYLFNHCNAESVQRVLESLGGYFDLERCLIRYNNKQASEVYTEWQAPGMRPMSELLASMPTPRASVDAEWFVEDCGNADTPSMLRNICELSGVKASAILPLRYDSELLGYIICHSVAPRNWDTRFRRALRIVADALAMVISKETILSRLEESRERFQMAMMAASYGLWELNLVDQSIYLSPTYFSMLGFSELERFDGFRPLIVDNVHIDDRETILKFARGLADGSVQEFSQESRHITINGDIVWILMRGRVVKWDENGRPTRAMGTLTDVSGMKKTHTDLQLAYQEAESAHVAKSEFLARMSHEIRTPMNAIIGMAYLALQSPLDAEQQRNIEDIDNAAKNLLQIIDDILDFSKIEAKKLTLEYHGFNFNKQMERLAAIFEDKARAAGLSFSVDIDPHIPRFIRCDSTRLRQVLNNLLSNAIKFTERGSVSLSAKKEGQHGRTFDLVFTVRDTGIGLDAAQIDSLFDPFTQGDGSSTRQYGGTGLGLAISKQLINMMGGDILVCSEPGRGSTFRFSVRCDETSVGESLEQDQEGGALVSATNAVHTDNVVAGQDKDNQKSTSELAAEQSPPSDPFRDMRVLVVEDNKVNQKVASVLLQRRGIKVTLANNGTEAVYMLKGSEASRFDLILMDIEMPYMGGFEATATIRAIERHSKVPIVAMTAHLVDGDKDRYLSAGMNDCVSKPITPAKLYQILEQVLSSR